MNRETFKMLHRRARQQKMDIALDGRGMIVRAWLGESAYAERNNPLSNAAYALNCARRWADLDISRARAYVGEANRWNRYAALPG